MSSSLRGPAGQPISIIHTSVAPAAAAAAPAPGARKPVAAQVVVALAGQSVTTLPDGQILTLGGQSPSGAVGRAALKPASPGVAAQLSVTLRKPRAYHTATVLPDGTVLVFGGFDRNGLVPEAELFNPEKQTSETIAAGPQARGFHTATLLTDGRVLIAGGMGRDGLLFNKIELWNPKSRTSEPFAQTLTFARRGHTAKLHADGSVLISGGITAAGTKPDRDEVIQVGDNTAQADLSELQIAASIPTNEAKDVAADVRVAIRFSRPLQVTTVTAVTVNLRDETGPVAAKVVAAEAGMLAFVTPDNALSPSTLYTVGISGARDTNDFVLPPTEINFTTADAPVSQAPPPKAQPQSKDDPPPPPLQAAAGATALYGHSRTSLGKYLPGVTLNLDCAGKLATAKTDSLGRFLLISTVAGHCGLEIDGTKS